VRRIPPDIRGEEARLPILVAVATVNKCAVPDSPDPLL
jgi:hypothetical protein